jgi:hypothetical protein
LRFDIGVRGRGEKLDGWNSIDEDREVGEERGAGAFVGRKTKEREREREMSGDS